MEYKCLTDTDINVTFLLKNFRFFFFNYITYQFRCPVVEHVWPTADSMNGCSVWQQRSLKNALSEGPGEKKVIESRKHSQRGWIPTHCQLRPRSPLSVSIGHRIIALIGDWMAPQPHSVNARLYIGATYRKEKT